MIYDVDADQLPCLLHSPSEIDIIFRSHREATLGSTDLMLRGKEFALLTLLVQNPGSVISRTVIAERVWGNPWVTDNVIGVTVSGLRQHLREAFRAEDVPESLHIETVRGAGFRFVVESE